MEKVITCSAKVVDNNIWIFHSDRIIATSDHADGLPNVSKGFEKVFFRRLQKDPFDTVYVKFLGNEPVLKNNTIIIRKRDKGKLYTKEEVKEMLSISFQLFSSIPEQSDLREKLKELFS